MYKCKFPFFFSFFFNFQFDFIVDTVWRVSFCCYFYKKKKKKTKKHFSIPSESRQVSSSFSCLATCFYTAYCSTSVSNTSLKCWLNKKKTFRERQLLFKCIKNKQEHKNVFFFSFFLFDFLTLCYLLSDKVLWNKVKGAHTAFYSASFLLPCNCVSRIGLRWWKMAKNKNTNLCFTQAARDERQACGDGWS